MNFGEKLDNLREKHGLNKKQLGEAVELSADTISQYSKKETVEGIDSMRLKRIADYFKISIDYFLDDSNDVWQSTNDKTYLKADLDEVDIGTLLNEIKSLIDDSECLYKGRSIEEHKKKYIVDSLEIGLMLLDRNF